MRATVVEVPMSSEVEVNKPGDSAMNREGILMPPEVAQAVQRLQEALLAQQTIAFRAREQGWEAVAAIAPVVANMVKETRTALDRALLGEIP